MMHLIFRILWWTESLKEQGLFKKEIFCKKTIYCYFWSFACIYCLNKGNQFLSKKKNLLNPNLNVMIQAAL